MRRREFVAATVAATVAMSQRSGTPYAQPIKRPALLGILYDSNEKATESNRAAFLSGMEQQGYVRNRDFITEVRYGEGMFENYKPLLTELVAKKPNLLLAGSQSPAIAAKQLTSNIPIVCPALNDPIGAGLARSIARPSGNVTGILYSVEQLGAAKQVQIGRELVPQARSCGVLVRPTPPGGDPFPARQAAVAAALEDFVVVIAEVPDRAALEPAFRKLAAEKVDFIVVESSGLFFADRLRIVAFANAALMPAIYPYRQFVEDGGLVSYGVNLAESHRRCAYFTVKILQGAKAGELPIELPTKIELLINQKAAKALGLSIPPTLLARADEVIE